MIAISIAPYLTKDPPDMIPMSELIKDPVYRKFLETPPKTPKFTRDPATQKSPPWVVYIKPDKAGNWGRKEFWKYSEAFHFFRKWMKKGAYDATINNKRYGFPPPMRRVRIKGKFITGTDGVERQATTQVAWKMKADVATDYPDHHWCRYCRRPVEFKYFSKHKRLGEVDPTTRRCIICGGSTRIAVEPASNLNR